MVVKEAFADAIKDIAPPAGVTAATFAGLPLSDWLLAATLLYTVVRLIAAMPRAFGCVACFVKAKGCKLTCKAG